MTLTNPILIFTLIILVLGILPEYITQTVSPRIKARRLREEKMNSLPRCKRKS